VGLHLPTQSTPLLGLTMGIYARVLPFLLRLSLVPLCLSSGSEKLKPEVCVVTS
jgi:hypothetical protein